MMQTPHETTAPQPPAFYELLSHIERRPGMYFGPDEHFWSGLEGCLLGYDAACVVHGHPQLLVGLPFARWIKTSKRVRIGGPSIGPFALVRSNFPDPAVAWKRFFQWFREYHTLTSGHQFAATDGETWKSA